MDYKSSGVDIDKSNLFVNNIKNLVGNSIGGFASTFEMPTCFKQPILVSSTDGVGTKLKIASQLNSFKNLGIDLVAMSVNDVITTGASPLFFLDYYSTSNLNLIEAQYIIEGIKEGCDLSNCKLVGGETAEMPNVYSNNEFDLAGFCVGIVEKSFMLSKNKVTRGDLIIGLESSGIHSNGFSLIRKILKEKNIKLFEHNLTIEDSIESEFIKPTKIYVKPLLDYLLTNPYIKSAAHITGGGLIHNISRSIPENYDIKLNKHIWEVPSIFKWIQKTGKVSEEEMFNVFNMGIGFVLIVHPSEEIKCLEFFNSKNIKTYTIGNIV